MKRVYRVKPNPSFAVGTRVKSKSDGRIGTIIARHDTKHGALEGSYDIKYDNGTSEINLPYRIFERLPSVTPTTSSVTSTPSVPSPTSTGKSTPTTKTPFDQGLAMVAASVMPTETMMAIRDKILATYKNVFGDVAETPFVYMPGNRITMTIKRKSGGVSLALDKEVYYYFKGLFATNSFVDVTGGVGTNLVIFDITEPPAAIEPKFKVGQKVRVAMGDDIGKIVTIRTVGENNGKPWYVTDSGLSGVEETFEEIEEPTFKVGDEIKITVGNLKGEFGTIIEVPISGGTTYVVKTDSGSRLFYAADELELISGTKFKVGDQVKIYSPLSTFDGSKGVVETVDAAGRTYAVRLIDGVGRGTVVKFKEKELLLDASAPAMHYPLFGAGDKVMVNYPGSPYNEAIGNVIDMSVLTPGRDYSYAIMLPTGNTIYMNEAVLKLISKAKPT